MKQADVVIIGAGIVGAAVAHYLGRSGAFKPGQIVLVERDTTYARASTSLSAGGLRQQFSTPENIAMSQATLAVVRNLDAEFSARNATVSFREQGYLILASEAGRDILARNHATATAAGADIALFGADDLTRRFPWLAIDGVVAGSFGQSGEGWFDPPSLAALFRQSARAQGSRIVSGDVSGFGRASDGRVASVRLAGGTEIHTGCVVNAAGPWAGQVARLAGIALPVEPRKRFVYVLALRAGPPELARAPLTVDPSGVWFRPEGRHFLCGRSPEPTAEPPTDDLGQIDHSFFEARVWPELAARVPAFENAKVINAWAGYYDTNTLDQNAIIGAHPQIANLYFANGFSGHGVQQAAGAGRAVAELIVHGRFQTLDLTRLGYDRIAANRPLAELNVI